MSLPENKWLASAMKLLPHQANFVETVFSPSSKRTILLRADVGLGKSVALVAVARRLLQERPNARVLFLGPSALRDQFAHMLKGAAVPTLLVDRYVFREMLDASPGGEIWPAGIVSLLSIDFAKQTDIRDSLALCHWDIVLVDEWHLSGWSRAEALRRIGTSAGRLVLTSATPPDAGLSDVFTPEDITVVEWQYDRIVDPEGKPLFAVQTRVVHEVSYTLNAMELSLRRTVGELCELLGSAPVVRGWQRGLLLRRLESSPAALDGTLQRLVERVAPPDTTEERPDLLDDAADDDTPTGPSEIRNSEEVARVAERALHEIEASASDSKLNAFGALLTRINEPHTPSRQIVILTDFVATLFYLTADIEGRAITSQLLHGAMGFEERLRSLQLFATVGGILVATRAVIGEGVDLRNVTDLVLYDAPHSNAALEQVFLRFARFGGAGRLNIYTLTPTNIPDGRVVAPLRAPTHQFRSGTDEGKRK